LEAGFSDLFEEEPEIFGLVQAIPFDLFQAALLLCIILGSSFCAVTVSLTIRLSGK
jgi:hypothetical protein